MATLKDVLEEFDPFTLLRDVETKAVNTARGWVREDGGLDPGEYEKTRHRGALAIMRLVAGVGDPAFIEVHAEHRVHDVVVRLELNLREAFEDCIPLACQIAAQEYRRAIEYDTKVTILDAEGYAISALFSDACGWRRGPGENQDLSQAILSVVLWTPRLRGFIRSQIRAGIRAASDRRIIEANAKVEQALGREQRAKNIGQAAGQQLGQLSAAVLAQSEIGSDLKNLAERTAELSRRAQEFCAR